MMQAARDMYDSAVRVSGQTGNAKAIRCTNMAMTHAEKAEKAHEAGDLAGANAHLGEAARHLHNAATVHTGTLSRGDFASPEILDLAHLGKAQEVHQNYVNEINEGKNNGR